MIQIPQHQHIAVHKHNSIMNCQLKCNFKTHIFSKTILRKIDIILHLSGVGLNDGQWHEVRFLAKENFAILTIDGDEASAVRTNSPLQVKTGEKYFFGGKNIVVC